jgi:hypothetical protein
MIVNATDLAETEEDLNAVIEYVGDALSQVLNTVLKAFDTLIA